LNLTPNPSPHPERGFSERERTTGGVSWHTSNAVWKELKPRARWMRHEATAAENALWQALRGRKLNGLKFRRQHSLSTYIADFYCAEARLVLEVDGSIHDQLAEQDAERDSALQAIGLTILRFTNDQILNNLPIVLHLIAEAAAPPSPGAERAIAEQGGEV
jgi:adenine-specific DNA-methyltransferase